MLRHYCDLLTSHLLPALAFALLLTAKLSALPRLWQSYAIDPTGQAMAAVVNQLAAACFTALIVVLFIVRGSTVGPHSSPLGALVALAGTFLTWLPLAVEPTMPSALQLSLAALLTFAGTAFAIVSAACLGRCFGLFPEARGLVTRGPYRLIRHPLYLGEQTAVLGAVLAVSSWSLCGLFLLQCALQVWRAHNEERALALVFPEYQTYSSHTWRFVPHLY